MSRQGRLGMVEKQLQWTQQPDGEVPTPWGALLLMRGGCMGPSYPFPSQGERKQETVPQLWGCDKLIFSSSKPTAMKKQGPKADPRRGGAVRIGMPRKPGAGEALELQGKGLKTGGGWGWGEAKKIACWYCRNGRMQGKELEVAGEPPRALPECVIMSIPSLQPWLLIKLLKLAICEWPFKPAKHF